MEKENVGIVDREKNIFGTYGEASEIFKFSSFRKHQKETIDEIEYAYQEGYKYVILNAPVGSGKSAIAMAFAELSKNAHLLTIQKILQDQYERDFGSNSVFVMKGRSTYKCLKSGGKFTCADGLCRRNRKIKPCSDCLYRIARKKALESEVTIHNFDSFYWTNLMSRGYSRRKLLIIDEAHNIPSKFSDFVSFTISSTPEKQVPKLYDFRDYYSFLKEQHEDYIKELEVISLFEDYDIDSAILGNLLKKEDVLKQKIIKLEKYLDKMERGEVNNDTYVFYYNDKGKYGGSVTFKPLFVDDFVTNYLFKYGERVLMMSGTILDKELFCKDIGIDPNDTYTIDVESIFSVEKRPIIYTPVGYMSYKYINDTLPKMIKRIKTILEKYDNERGIIQTHSEKIANYIKSNLKLDRLTFNKDYKSVSDMLKVHKNKPNSVIVASGLREGLDLYGDLSRFQIFVKVPYPDLSDKWVKRRMELDKRWYGYMTSISFVQALGRSVRSENDYADTYLLDANFEKFFIMNRKYIPDYIFEAIV